MVLLMILFYINYLFITTRRENILHISVHGETKALAWLIFLFFFWIIVVYRPPCQLLFSQNLLLSS